jgi:ribosome-associated protein
MKTPDPQDIRFEYFRASGPGGQHVNKVATGVRLRYDLRNAALPEAVKQRLSELAGQRLTREGELIIEASRFRSRGRNQQQALRRLEALLKRAWQSPRQRKATRPGRAAIQRRLQRKKRRGQLKQQRGAVKDWE